VPEPHRAIADGADVDDRDRRRGRLGPPGRILADLVAVAAGWLLFAGSLAVGELVAAVTVGVAAALAGALLRRHVGHRHRGARRWARHLPRMLLQAVVDSWTVTVELVRTLRGAPPRSRLRALPFDVRGDGADDVGRRVLTTVGLTLQPNSVVLGFDADREVVLVHELVPTEGSPVPDDLAGRP
jgi:multisubunit Na+/H+ antiporter MnhE subunit